MKRSVLGSVIGIGLVAFAGCGDDDAANVDSGPIITADAAPVDAVPVPDAMPQPDAQLFDLQAAVGIDSMSLAGTNPTFSTLRNIVNPQLQQMIGAGTLLIALEFRGLDDPSGQDDDALTIGFYNAEDPDFDAANNFDAPNPDRWVASAQSIDSSGEPLVQFDNASITAGALVATSTDGVAIPGLPIDFAVEDAQITGILTPASDAMSVHFLEDGVSGKSSIDAVFQGVMPVSVLGGQANLASMVGCSGGNLLDVMALGCPDGTFVTFGGAQPDRDRDDDGLELLCDTCDAEPCATAIATGGGDVGTPGTPDGAISCCVDGDNGMPTSPRTVTTGANCWDAPAFADGYLTRFDIHATRVILMSEVAPTPAQ